MGVERSEGAGGGLAGAAAALNGSPPDRPEEPPNKRPKLILAEDASALRKRILEYKLLRLRNLREKSTELLKEQYFLEAGGNMIDYVAWRKRPPAPALASYVEARRTGGGAESVASLDAAVDAPPSGPEPQAGADEVVEKARAEAAVAARIAALARGGLWAERRLPRVLEPPRPKTHWDYLLEEMAWLAQDFAHERKWKKQAAKKCARAVQKYFQDKALAAQKAEKAQELQLRKIAAFAAKEIRTFWANVEKVVEWKRSVRVERARKQALDEQLSYIVDRTERYSRQLAANLHPERRPPSDDEFQPRGDSDDDEETIAAAERDDPADHRRELDALRRESRLDLGELLPAGYLPEHSPPPSDYGGDEDSADDESTIDEQERAERPDETAAELDALRSEADLDIEELLSRYPRPPVGGDAAAEATAEETAEDVDDEASSDSSEAESSASERAPLEALVADEADGEDRVEAAASLAASLQPTGTTLSDTAVGTPVPRLLRHTLREYQQVGLHWLATMHARRLNGILADEMGLGKTIQTIALLAHLALERQDWGPHLVVAPTSLVLNWEYEFKKWCPAFKLLTYYGTIKERKLKRVGWTKANSFHVCITSYKLVVQDHQSFRRKRWKYLILDEAQNIKNFKSQRWQMLLNFQTERRLLLTGTPLQNSLLELWSLMHFLMPSVFASHSEFREWFAPVAGIAEGAASRQSDALLRRLHEVLRPFLLRRLKADVERQLPRKHEHVLLCRLAKRQRFLYDDFMSRAKTKESLASGNLLSVINVLMQLRKVCNHPDLFEPRPVTSPLHLAPLRLRLPALLLLACVRDRRAAAARLGGDLASLELHVVDAFAAHRARHLAPPRRLVEELAERPAPTAPRPPPAALRLHLRLVPRAPPSRLAAVAPQPPRLLSAPLRATDAPAPVVPHPREGGAARRLEAHRASCMRRTARVNERRCWRLPLFGADLRAALSVPTPPLPFAPQTIDDVLAEMHDVIDRFGVCWAACRAEPPSLACGGGEGARAWRRSAAALERALALPLRRALTQLHAPAQRQAVAFPHPRLLQYDCGKLQTLDGLLRRLRAGAHRVLIFTQMTRVLDVLEAFLSMHGHTYLRLDGATRVDLRQPLVDRFNTDPRIFAFILSTRSGGVGLNLTGADSVVFYDSDWNPTMDAQAQDRCHRIGQTRDVHVFRLVTAATVEENILRKAEQKRALGHLAIEDGHFTTSYLRDANVRELFGGDGGGVAADGGELESALAACEDEADAAAAAAARAEAHRDLAEFDESVPLDDVADAPVDAPDECAALVKQLSPVERYAMRVVESGEAATEAERAALEDMRRQLREWEKARAALREGPDAPDHPDRPDAPDQPAEPRRDDDDEPLTYSGEDARTKVWICASPAEDAMPMWGPPTPPSSDGDVYCDSWARALYRRGAAADALLPPVRWRDPRAARSPRRLRPAPRPPLAPPSLFGLRPRARPRAPPPAARDPAVPPPEWSPCEDAALRRALRSQRLPAETPAALAPNWEWLAELVNEVSRAYRSPRACRDRHDVLADPERARRKHRKPPQARRRPDEETPRPPLSRLEAMRDAAERRRAAPKRRHDDAAPRNPKHAALLADQGLDYDAPPTPMEVATRRAERIAKEKLKGGATPTGAGPAGAPQRVVVAAGGVQAGKAERREAVTPRGAHLVYRQPSPAARHHLKILHHAPPAHSQSIVTSGSGTSVSGVVASVEGVSVSGGGAAALRTLQLQQLALRRASRPHQHVVLAHLAPAQSVAAQPQPAAQQPVAASQPSAPPQQQAPDSRH